MGKKIFSIVLAVGFAVAICHAVPYHSGFDYHKTELAKKHFELQEFEVPVAFEMSKAPLIVHDQEVRVVKQSEMVVIPYANSPPKRRL